MRVDFHCHLLAGLDDGAASTDVSLQMLSMLRQQGVTAVFATPHYLPWLETPAAFASRRAQAMQELQAQPGYPKDISVFPAAEVALQMGLSSLDLQPLCYADYPAMLLELPKGLPWAVWMAHEIENIAFRFRVRPVLAHMERYLGYPDEALDCLLQLPQVVVQLNASFVQSRHSVRFFQRLCRAKIPVLLGTDAHNTSSRPPNFPVVDHWLCAMRQSKATPLREWLTYSAQHFLHRTGAGTSS